MTKSFVLALQRMQDESLVVIHIACPYEYFIRFATVISTFSGTAQLPAEDISVVNNVIDYLTSAPWYVSGSKCSLVNVTCNLDNFMVLGKVPLNREFIFKKSFLTENLFKIVLLANITREMHAPVIIYCTENRIACSNIHFAYT